MKKKNDFHEYLVLTFPLQVEFFNKTISRFYASVIGKIRTRFGSLNAVKIPEFFEEFHIYFWNNSNFVGDNVNCTRKISNLSIALLSKVHNNFNRSWF